MVVQYISALNYAIGITMPSQLQWLKNLREIRVAFQTAHKGHTRKGGTDYFNHCESVESLSSFLIGPFVDNYQYHILIKIVALGHDVYEDRRMTKEELATTLGCLSPLYAQMAYQAILALSLPDHIRGAAKKEYTNKQIKAIDIITDDSFRSIKIEDTKHIARLVKMMDRFDNVCNMIMDGSPPKQVYIDYGKELAQETKQWRFHDLFIALETEARLISSHS